MSTLKISKHSDVPAALDIVKDEVGEEAKRIHEAGGDALKAGKINPAMEAIEYSKKLAGFVEKIKALAEEWRNLEALIDAAPPEVKEIVMPGKPVKPHKTGYARKVVDVGPKTNFTVTFPDGTVIADKKAYWVLARSIEKMGPDKVAELGVTCGGEPLVTQDRSLYKKHPHAVAELPNGWLVNTHSSTATKIGYVKRVANALKVEVVVKER